MCFYENIENTEAMFTSLKSIEWEHRSLDNKVEWNIEIEQIITKSVHAF